MRVCACARANNPPRGARIRRRGAHVNHLHAYVALLPRPRSELTHVNTVAAAVLVEAPHPFSDPTDEPINSYQTLKKISKKA